MYEKATAGSSEPAVAFYFLLLVEKLTHHKPNKSSANKQDKPANKLKEFKKILLHSVSLAYHTLQPSF